jgi:hypothetical protein
MTGDTQRNKVISISPIFAINVGPLYESWSIVRNATLLARGWFTKCSHDPLMESPVTNVISFPAWMFRTQDFQPLRLCPFTWSLVAGIESRCSSVLYKFFISIGGVASTRTEKDTPNTRWRNIKVLNAITTFNCWHTSIIQYFQAKNN